MQDPQQQPPPRAEQARVWRRYLRFFGPRAVADVDDELTFHVEMCVRDQMARGLSESDARRAVADRFGDLARTRMTCVTIATRRERRMTRAQIVDAFVHDVRFGLRTLGRNKAWTAVAVLTLAVGIGANTAMFSVVNKLMLNPIPYPDADRVVVAFQEPSQGNSTGLSISVLPMGRVVAAWRQQSRSFDVLEPYRTTDVTLQRQGESARIAHTAAILPSFANLAGQTPIIGRVFTEKEAKGEASVVLLGEGMWRSEYGAARDVVGKTLLVNEQVMTIVGVMPGAFQLPRTSEGDMDLWLPLDLARADDDGLMTVGRLKAGVDRAPAARELDAIANALESNAHNRSKYNVILKGPAEFTRLGDTLILLSVVVGLVLLIACANVAHLLLARAATRQREMAIRAALGAGTERLFRQLFTESLMLSVAGCLGGLLVGWVGLRLLTALRPQELSDLAAARMDGLALLVTVGLSLITGLAFGVIGAVQASRHSTHDALKSGAPAASPGRAHGRARNVLVITEMALCTALLVGAALLLRSVIYLQAKEAGFDAHELYSVDLDLPTTRYDSDARRQAFFAQLVARVRTLPGVQGVTTASAAPPGASFMLGALQIEGQPAPPAGTTSFISFNGVQPDFFRVMRMRILEGSTFTDTTSRALQAIVNEGMARKFWPGQSAIGRRLRIVYDGRGEWMTIVGVVNNALTTGLTHDVSEPMLYRPGTGFFKPSLLVRTAGDATVIQTLTRLAQSRDTRLPPARVTSVEQAMHDSIARPRFTMFLLMVFTAIAVVLAAIGLYGVMAYTVARRTREIGIRMALGAPRSSVARDVLSHGLLMVAIGAAIGLLIARNGAKLLAHTLHGIQQTDLTSFVAAVMALVAIAALACLVPVRRAISVDPVIAMRAD